MFGHTFRSTIVLLRSLFVLLLVLAAAGLIGCDSQINETKMEPRELLVEAGDGKRLFIYRLEPNSQHDILDKVKERSALVKFSFETADLKSGQSSQVEFNVGVYPLREKVANELERNCFLQPGACQWHNQKIDLQNGFKKTFTHTVKLPEGVRAWEIYVEVNLVKGVDIQGTLDMQLNHTFDPLVSKEDADSLTFGWLIQEFFNEQ